MLLSIMKRFAPVLLSLCLASSASAYHDWESSVITGEWFNVSNWRPGTLPTLSSSISRLPSYDPVAGAAYHYSISASNGAQAGGIWLGRTTIATARLEVITDLEVPGGITVYSNGILTVTNGGRVISSSGITVEREVYIGPGSSITCNTFMVQLQATGAPPRAIVQGELYVLGEGVNMDRFYVNGLAIGANNAAEFRGEMIIDGGTVNMPALGMSRYLNKRSRLVVSNGTLIIRGSTDGLSGGGSTGSIVEIVFDQSDVFIQNNRQLSVSGAGSRITQRGGFVRAGSLGIGSDCLYEIESGELLIYAGESTMGNAASVFRIIGPEPDITMNTFGYDAAGAIEYVMTRAPGHIAPIHFNYEVRRMNTLPVSLKGGVLLAATNEFTLMTYTYGSRDETPPANPDIWATDWVADNDTRCRIRMTGYRGALAPDAETTAVFTPASAGVVSISNATAAAYPSGLSVQIDVEPQGATTLESIRDGIIDAGYTNTVIRPGDGYELTVVIPPEDLTASPSHFAWDFYTGFTNAPAATVRALRIDAWPLTGSAVIIE